MSHTTQPLIQLPEWCLSGNINYSPMADLWTPTGLVRIAPTRCSIGDHEPSEQCCNTAEWEYNRYPICIEHIREMYGMFPDDREALQPALDEVRV